MYKAMCSTAKILVVALVAVHISAGAGSRALQASLLRRPGRSMPITQSLVHSLRLSGGSEADENETDSEFVRERQRERAKLTNPPAGEGDSGDAAPDMVLQNGVLERYRQHSGTGPLVIGIDGGTESIRAGLFTVNGTLVASAAAPYTTTFPRPGWAEQNPEDWWRCLGEAVKGALAAAAALESGGSGEALAAIRDRVQALCVDTTCCTVVALDARGDVLRPALLWMDSRSAPQAARILADCRGTDALKVNCNGEGPLSAEWMLPKCLWLKEEEAATWSQATTICEYQDFINFKLTGRMCTSSCNTAARWHWDGEAAIDSPSRGRPLELIQKLGMSELADKWPRYMNTHVYVHIYVYIYICTYI